MESTRGLVFDGLTMCFGLWMAAAVSGRIVEGGVCKNGPAVCARRKLLERGVVNG